MNIPIALLVFVLGIGVGGLGIYTLITRQFQRHSFWRGFLSAVSPALRATIHAEVNLIVARDKLIDDLAKGAP